MKRTVLLGERELTYTLVYKKVKNINLRIKTDGVTVSAPRGVKAETVDELLRSRVEYILKALDHLQSAAPPVRQFREGDLLPCIGAPCVLYLHKGDKNTAQLGYGVLNMTVTDPDDVALKEATWEAWKRTFSEELFTSVCCQVHPRFAAHGVPFPIIRYRRMRSRWGSCCPAKKTITLNTALVEKPLDQIEYVVCHELTHFLHPDHSSAFYAALAQFCPAWKLLRDRLNGKTE